MDLSPIIYFEIGAAITLALGVLCAKPDYGLFLYGLALGFPDAAIPLGSTINIRVDDILIVFFLLRSVAWRPAPLTAGQRKILLWQVLFLMVCIISAFVGFTSGNPPGDYETVKMLGCAVIVFTLPRVLQSERRLRFLVAGLMCAGVALIAQIVFRIGTSAVDTSANFQALKSSAAFTTWNPNTIGQAAMLVVFASGVGWFVFPKSATGRVMWFLFSVGFALTPAMVFVRGTTLSIVAAYVLFLCLSRSWKWALVFLLVCFAGFLYLQSSHRELVESATQVDLATGEGLSHRFDRWSLAIEAVETAPFRGQGFGQEWNYLSEQGSEGRAHNAYLSVWIDLGIGGLALLLAMIYQFVTVGFSLYRNPKFQLCGALILALIAAACVDSLALPTMYWEKIPTISLSIAVGLAGICERKSLEAAPQPLHIVEMTPIAENS